MHKLVCAEVRKLWHSWGVRVTTALLLGLVGFAYWQTHVNVQRGVWDAGLLSPAFSLTYATALLAVGAPMLAAVVGAICSGQEFACRTWSLLLTQGSRRHSVCTAKLLAVALTLGTWLAAALLLGYGLSMWTSGRFGWPVVDAITAAQMSTVYSTMLFWGLFSFVFGLAFRGTAGGAAMGAGFPILEAFIYLVPAVRVLLPVWNQRTLNAAVFGTEPIGMVIFPANPGYPSTGQALAVLLILFVVFSAAAYRSMERQLLL